MAQVPLIPPRDQFFDNNGNPLAGGKVYFYAAGTSTPKNTYTDSTGSTPNSNPVILDSAGRASIWGSGAYKVVVATSADVILTTDDNYTSFSASSISAFSDASFTIQDDGDTTKQLMFQLSGITTGTTVTLTAPSQSGTISIGASTILNSQSSSYTLLASDNGKLVKFTGSSDQTWAFTDSATLGNGWCCYIQNAGTSNATITLDPSGSQLIDGLTSYPMYGGEIRFVQCTGSAFNTIVLHPFDTGTRTSTFNFISPPGYSLFNGWLWGSGASGGTAGTGLGGGGGGGACVPFTINSSTIGAAGTSTTVTIAAGGASVSAANTAGNAGNTSTFGSFFSAFGGGRGGGSVAAAGGGGGGSGRYAPSAGSSPTYTSGVGGNATTTTAGTGGVSWESITGAATNVTGSIYGGGGGASSASGAGGGYYGGAGGAGGSNNFPGHAIYGGGGGNGAAAGAGGQSMFGGAGGAAASTASAGTAPGGGGGGGSAASGAGGDGGCRIIGRV